MEPLEPVGGCPNRLFVSYLEKLRARSERKKDGRSVVLYDKALASLRRYPLPLRSAKEARALRGVGARVAADLEMCLAKYGAHALVFSHLHSHAWPGLIGAADYGKRKAEDALSTREGSARIDADHAPQDEAVAGPSKRHRQGTVAQLRETVLTTNASAASTKLPTSVDDDDLIINNNNNNDNDDNRPPVSVARDAKVVLIVDHRELKKTRTGQKLRAALEDLGVPMEQKSLNLADMVWVARKGHREVVLKHG
jgi:hypothetical protein